MPTQKTLDIKLARIVADQLAADIGQPVSLPPVVADGVLYVLDDSGTITAYR